jgi:DNA-binding CsgD family transcriptional regulator
MPSNCFSVYKAIKSLIKQTAWLVLLLLAANASRANAVKPGPANIALNYFNHLDTVPQAERVAKAGFVYKWNCHHLKEKEAMAVLDTLELIAKKLDDKALECSVYALRADYYSVNNAYNNTSINYLQQAVDFASAHNMPVQVAVYLHKKGLYYFTFAHNTEACRYFLQAYDKFLAIGLGNIPDISTYILEQAKFYYVLKDYGTAKTMLQTALHYPIKNTRVGINVVNTIGLIYRSNHQYPQALFYFDKTLKTAIEKKDTAWIGIVKGNIGSVYFMQGQYDKAMPYLLYDYYTALKYNEFGDAAQSLLRISHIDFSHQQIKKAALLLDTVGMLLHKSTDDVFELRIDLYNQLVALYQNMGRLDSALAYTKKYEAARDSLAERNNMASIERVKLTWETEQYRNQIGYLKTKAETEHFKRNAIIVIFFLLMVILILLFNRFRMDAVREQEMLLIRKKRVDEKLKAAAESLNQYTEHLKQNNIAIEKYKAEIAVLKAQTTSLADTGHLEKLMEAHIMTDENWDDFKKLFNKAHSGFFLNLRKNFPNLTDTDMRLLALIKLGLNNREMANMLGITVEGIKKSKQRLRKKMELTNDLDIEGVIAAL